MRIVGPIQFWRVCVIYLERKKNGAVDASTRLRIHASARSPNGSTQGRWTLCSHPPFLGLHTCNKMGSTPVLPHKIRQNQHTKKNFFLRGNFRPLSKKNVRFWDHFFPELFPKDSESLKFLDIRLREGGANIYISAYMGKRDKHTYIHTYIQTDIATTRSNRPRGANLMKRQRQQ